jgi:anthranilate synthase/aminodeoxychorismate synthase-like glutamine amidotransferase
MSTAVRAASTDSSAGLRLLLIDNYDSFTYNLVQAFMVLGAEVEVRRNDTITVEEALALQPTHVCISPGPGAPHEAGISIDAIRAFAGKVPVFGVCLGHQSITEAFGGKVVRAQRQMHGKTSQIDHDGAGLFEGMPNPCIVGRYHSLIAAPESLPAELRVTARTSQGEIMGLRHCDLLVEGVQFHPESVLTPEGPQLMANFLKQRGGRR